MPNVILAPNDRTPGLQVELEAEISSQALPTAATLRTVSHSQLGEAVTLFIKAPALSQLQLSPMAGTCLIRLENEHSNRYTIVSGAFAFELKVDGGAPANPLWPHSEDLIKILVGPSGVQIDVASGNQRLRLQSVQATASERVWQLRSVENEPALAAEPAAYLSPHSRLEAIKGRLPEREGPIHTLEAFFADDGSVYYIVGDDGTITEIVRPTWALAVFDAIWQPRFARIDSEEEVVFFDGETPWEGLPEPNAAPAEVHLIWPDINQEPEPKALPTCHATGGVSGIKPNHPYVWHFADLQRDTAIAYTGVWVRYHLAQWDRRPAAPSVGETSALNRPLRIALTGWTLHLDVAAVLAAADVRDVPLMLSLGLRSLAKITYAFNVPCEG